MDRSVTVSLTRSVKDGMPFRTTAQRENATKLMELEQVRRPLCSKIFYGI